MIIPLRLGAIVGVMVLLTVGVADAVANTRWVANNGLDSGTCGSQQSPCRSISQAMNNASAGDTIYVGPGRYGDVNGDGFTGPGDEQPSGSCIVCITKPLHIYSVDGAASTVVASDPSSAIDTTVMIQSFGVDFGSAGHGFTLTGGNSYGVQIMINTDVDVSGNISVAGNIDVGDGTAFHYFGDPDRPPPGCPSLDCVFTVRLLIDGNQAIENKVGFFIEVNDALGPGQIIVRNNLSIGAATGFALIPGGAQDDADTAGQVQLLGNIAESGGTGFYANSIGIIEYNTAIGNSQAGFVITPEGSAFTHNAAIGNGGPGVVINLSPDQFFAQSPQLNSCCAFNPLSDNNFYGNDRNRTSLAFVSSGYFNPWAGYSAGSSAHCGILDLGGLSSVALPDPLPPPAITQIQATNNYWGSTTGPSSSGPADAVGGQCDQNNMVTIAKPFSATAFAGTPP